MRPCVDIFGACWRSCDRNALARDSLTDFFSVNFSTLVIGANGLSRSRKFRAGAMSRIARYARGKIPRSALRMRASKIRYLCAQLPRSCSVAGHDSGENFPLELLARGLLTAFRLFFLSLATIATHNGGRLHSGAHAGFPSGAGLNVDVPRPVARSA